MYYIFYKTDDGGSDAQGAFLTQDISSHSFQQGDQIHIEWTLGIPSLLDNQLPLVDSFGYPMVWSGASYPDTRVNVYVYGDDDGNGTAYGTLITHQDIFATVGVATSFFDEEVSFSRTLGIGTGAITTTDTSKFNKIMFKVAKIESGQTFYIDYVDFRYDVTATNNWTLSNVVNSNGTLIFSDGGEAVQTGSNLIEAGKTYRITLGNPAFVSGFPKLYVNGELIIGSSDITFVASSNDVTVSVVGGVLSLSSITIEELEPYGGTVNFWDLNGGGADGIAGTSDDDNFIFTSQASGGSIVFDEAPQDTYLRQELINTNQIIDFDIGTKCIVSFNITNYVGSGELTFMLYNDEGEGFEHTISGNGSYSFSGTIGNDSSTTLTSIFGFYVSSTDTFSGVIDNVDIVLDSNNSGKTISFNEKSKGWTSLKSFIPEFAISSVNQYYTMDFGQLWKHHQEFGLDGTTPVDRNTFYDVFEDSSVTPVLNTQPEVVKNFNTLNYEGSQSRVDEHLTDDQYYNLETKKGWFVEDIHTDKQEGTLSEFIEKEGKWFNYIKGKPGQVDTAAFNFQGLGIIQDIEIYGCTIPTATNFDPLATTNDGSCGFASGAFELQLRDTTSPSNADGAARIVYTGTNIEPTGFTYAWSNGSTASEATGLGMGPIAYTLTDGTGATHNASTFVYASIVNGCTDPTATNYNYSANTDDGTCTI
mgnify:FL=1